MLNLENGRGYYESNHDTGGPDIPEKPTHTYELNTAQEAVPTNTLPESKHDFLNTTDTDNTFGSSSSASAGNTGSGVEFDTLEVPPQQVEIVKLDESSVPVHEFIQPDLVIPRSSGTPLTLLNVGVTPEIENMSIHQMQNTIAALDAAAEQEVTSRDAKEEYEQKNYADIIGVTVQTPHGHWSDMHAIGSGSSSYQPVDLVRGAASKIMSVGTYWKSLGTAVQNSDQLGNTPPNLYGAKIVTLIKDKNILRPVLYTNSVGRKVLETHSYYGDIDFSRALTAGDLSFYIDAEKKHIHVPLTEVIYDDTLKELASAATNVYTEKTEVNQKNMRLALEATRDHYPELQSLGPIDGLYNSSDIYRALKRIGVARDRLNDITDEIDQRSDQLLFPYYAQNPEMILQYSRALARASEEARSKVK